MNKKMNDQADAWSFIFLFTTKLKQCLRHNKTGIANI